ncbi:MAG: alpha/beta fold hydrolase [Planctomycetes bacterium]|nr:alpha/beta fold hydrolase [Planctomycetota bacterium]
MTSPARIAHYPTSLRERAALRRLGPDVPALLIEPEAGAPAPVLLWLHGRTVSKELDSARYTRLMRAGVGVCALDLPGHGEREDPALQASDALPDLLAAALGELDGVVDDLRRVGWVDPERLAIGGMSAGGMVTLRRLCDPHPFRCAVVEATAGDFARAGEGRFEEARRRGLDPLEHLDGWRPLPLLAMHSEADAVVPVAAIRGFIEALRARGAGPVELATWLETGAPQEHLGFGRVAGEARQRLVAFLAEHLLRA